MMARTRCSAFAIVLLPLSGPGLTQVSHTVMVTSGEDLDQCSRPSTWMMRGLGKTDAEQVKRRVRARQRTAESESS